MNYKFQAIIQKHPEKDATYIEIPFNVEEVFHAKRVKVIASFDGILYRGSIVKMGLPCYMIGLTKEIRKALGKETGDSILVEIRKDEEERIIVLPNQFKQELQKNKKANEFYEKLSYSAKRKYYQWVSSAKKQETMDKRIHEAVVKLENEIKL